MNIQPDGISLDNPTFISQYMVRPRINKLLEQLTNRQVVYVIAGAGYGKTQAVLDYINQYPDAVVRWVHMTDSDNIGSRFWESLVHAVSADNPDLAVKLTDLGFPESGARFRQFAAILKNNEHRAHKTFLVLDDFHLIKSKQALKFVERCVYENLTGSGIIIISRMEPQINLVSLFSKSEVGVLTEDELRYTEDEIASLLKQRGIPYAAAELPRFVDVTGGWAFAINLLIYVLTRQPKNLNHAFGTMKQNIFKLFETEAWNSFPKRVQKNMVRVSLVSDLPFSMLDEISEDTQDILETSQLTSFMWFDSFIGNIRIHPLYLEFLNSKRHILSQNEVQDTYKHAAKWCCENNFPVGAINYYAKSKQYGRMLESFLSYPFKLPYDTCEYFLRILEELSLDESVKENIDVLLLKCFIIPILLIGMGRYEDAKKQSLELISQWEQSDAPFAKALLTLIYSNLAYIDTYICISTHEYNAPEYMEKSLEYRKKDTSKPAAKAAGAFHVADIRSFACLVGEGADISEFGKYLESVRETASYIARTPHGMYYGYDDLASCEFAFFKNQPEVARRHANTAVLKAREKNQYGIVTMANQYLLRMAIHEGNALLAKEILKQLRDYQDKPDYWNRQLLYDLSTGFCYAQIGFLEMVPSWLVIDDKETTSEVHIPTRELIVSTKYHIAAQKYDHALAVLCNAYPRIPQERFLFGELTLSLLLALVRHKTGDNIGAVKDFEKAYELSLQGVFVMPFIELGKDLRPLMSVVLKNEDNTIPENWLGLISRKAAIYAKKSLIIAKALQGERKADNVFALSEREREVLLDLYHGLSREEIATNQFISINSVKKILQSIFIKLDANSSVDAIRIALEKRLLD